MLTKKEVGRLRGLVARHARCEWNMGATAGDRGTEPGREQIVEDAKKARKAIYAELSRLMEKI